MSESFDQCCGHACEFTIALQLNVPIFLEPHVLVKDAPCVKQTLPEIFVKSEVKAKPPVCIPQKPYCRDELPAYSTTE